MRSIYALAGKAHMSAEVEGEEINTGPLVVFISMLSKYIRQVDPHEVVVCWDGGRSTKRMAIYLDYKGERKEPFDRSPMFDLAKQALTLLGVFHIEMPGVEADDLIAYYWRHCEIGGYDEPRWILSGDKDFLQLLDHATFQIRPGGPGGDEVWGVERVVREMGCHPLDLAKVMALTGDKSDCIPGVPGFGTKTAVKVLASWEWNLERAMRREKRLLGYRETVERNYRLIDLRTMTLGLDLPQPPRWQPTDRTGVLYQDALDFTKQYDLSAIRDRLTDGTLWEDR
jgi:5'-3' exonuclease